MMLLGAVGFITNNLYVLFGTLFLLGVHSTVFSPVKFGILPTYLHKHELVAGNAMIEGATFLAIVSGIIAGTQIILIEPIGHYITSISLIILAITGYISCLRMPRVRPNSPNIKIGWNIFAHTYEILADMWHNKEVTKYVLSSGWFWFVAAVLVTIFPLYVSDVLYLNKNVYTLILVIFAVGVGIGSTLCSVFLKGIISAKYTPVAAIIMGIFAIDLGFQSQPFHTIPAQGLVADLLADVRGWRILFDFAAIAIGGGFYVVPFFALIQDRSPKEAKSRMIAASNIVNAAFMVSAAGFMFVAKHIGLDLPETLIVIGGMGLTGALIVHIITPDSVLRFKKKE
jgi:MFS family permease